MSVSIIAARRRATSEERGSPWRRRLTTRENTGRAGGGPPPANLHERLLPNDVRSFLLRMLLGYDSTLLGSTFIGSAILHRRDRGSALFLLLNLDRPGRVSIQRPTRALVCLYLCAALFLGLRCRGFRYPGGVRRLLPHL